MQLPQGEWDSPALLLGMRGFSCSAPVHLQLTEPGCHQEHRCGTASAKPDREFHSVQSCWAHPAPSIRNGRTQTQSSLCLRAQHVLPGLSCTAPVPLCPLAFLCKNGGVNPRTGLHELVAVKFVISQSAKPNKIPSQYLTQTLSVFCLQRRQ